MRTLAPLALVALLLGCSGPPAAPRLWIRASEGHAVVHPSAEAQYRYENALKAGDSAQARDSLRSGEGYAVANGTGVELVEPVGGGVAHVRLLDGDLRGREGWLAAYRLQDRPPAKR